jgi:DNA-binding response OmpR family regulator
LLKVLLRRFVAAFWLIGCSAMVKVHLIEDESEIRRLVADALAAIGHDVETSATALDGLQQVVATSPDVVVLDLGLPDLDGGEMLKMLRAVSSVPVIIATARDDDTSTIRLLNAGADDYIVKPYSIEHLEARIRAVLRRGPATSVASGIKVGDLEIDPGSREARLGGSILDLSPKEFDLLLLLAERSGQVVSKREILAEVWREPYGGSERTVDVHLSWLRKKLGESASDPKYLQTVHGVGIKLIDP